MDVVSKKKQIIYSYNSVRNKVTDIFLRAGYCKYCKCILVLRLGNKLNHTLILFVIKKHITLNYNFALNLGVNSK